MLRLARIGLLAGPAAVILLWSGIAPPAIAATAVTGVLLLEAVVIHRLFLGARRSAASHRAALHQVADRLLTVQVVQIIGFNLQSLHSLVLWVLRRRSGVPPGAVEVSYAREEVFIMSLWQFAMAVETVGVDILLRGLGAPDWLRIPILIIDVYGLLFGIGVLAANATRPHVITDDELRIRYGPFFDLRIPRDRITSVRLARNRNETGMIAIADGTLAAAVTAQTNLIVELDEPVTVIRPLGRRAEARTIRFFADAPEPALAALRPAARSAA